MDYCDIAVCCCIRILINGLINSFILYSYHCTSCVLSAVFLTQINDEMMILDFVLILRSFPNAASQ